MLLLKKNQNLILRIVRQLLIHSSPANPSTSAPVRRLLSGVFFLATGAPIRTIKVTTALAKMKRGVDWGNFNILVVNMPPGTGDAQITISQNLKLSGSVIVSTPQDVALADANQGITMFDKMLGLVENMSCFVCPHCNEPSFIFGKEGARRTAVKKSLKLIGEIPLEMKIREGSDEGFLVVVSSLDSIVSKAYEDLAQNVVNGIKEARDYPENVIKMKLNVPNCSHSS